jgi:hypothetical protein
MKDGVSILGTVKGNLLVYKNGEIIGKPLLSHKGMVSALLERDGQLLAAGQDGMVCTFKLESKGLVKISQLDLSA